MDDTIAVDRAALRQVLEALTGPGYYIRELQVTMSLPDNPIAKLVEQFNAVIEQEAGNAD
jgi:hypothetical protein